MELIRNGLSLATKVDPERLHMTLGISEDFVEFPSSAANAMLAVGDAVAGEPQKIALDCLAGSDASVALRPARSPRGLRLMQKGIGDRLFRRGLARSGWQFNPHVTLGYRQGLPFRTRVEPIEWKACDFVLVHSVVGKTIHRELARWPLVPRQYSLPFV
ncbi:2'-5' RNA ligase family protein [Pelagerythrobacter sp.]|uniref:2'-5' RNA ligase family protein n=1 Tax=Pelagerythrobacter sp. TaxID=2800702 RepID=UPI0035AF2D65